MAKTNPEKQKEYKQQVKAKQNSDYLKTTGKKKEQRESFWRNPLHSIKSTNKKNVKEWLLRKQQNNLSIHQPILLLKNLVSKHLEKAKKEPEKTCFSSKTSHKTENNS